MAFTDTWNENYPVGTTPANELDTAISQTVKRALRERLAVDHQFALDESLITNVGAHNKVSFLNQASDPTQLADAIIAYAKDSPESKSERFVISEDGYIMQQTQKGAPLNGSPLINKTGSSLAYGDVVIQDISNDNGVTTTTSANSPLVAGVVAATIANNGTGLIVASGYMKVAVTGSVTRGDYLCTSTTVKLAKSAGTILTNGCFAQALTADSGGFVYARVFPCMGSLLALSGAVRGDMIRMGASAFEKFSPSVVGHFPQWNGTDMVMALLSGSLKVKAYTWSRTAAAGGGDQAFTGLGATCRGLMITGAAENQDHSYSNFPGFASSPSNMVGHPCNTSGFPQAPVTDNMMYVHTNAPDGYKITFKTADPDGLTVTYNVVGTPITYTWSGIILAFGWN